MFVQTRAAEAIRLGPLPGAGASGIRGCRHLLDIAERALRPPKIESLSLQDAQRRAAVAQAALTDEIVARTATMITALMDPSHDARAIEELGERARALRLEYETLFAPNRSTPPCRRRRRRSSKEIAAAIKLAIELKRSVPGKRDKAIAAQVEVDPSLLSRHQDYRAVKRVVREQAAEAANRRRAQDRDQRGRRAFDAS